MIVAGEASGDLLAAELVEALREKLPWAEFFGAPGPKMRAAGVESIFDSDDWSVVGIGAVAKAVPKFLRIKTKLLEAAERRKPDAIVLVDFPEFNLKLARSLKKRGHQVIYYVSPQLWAWRKYRARTIRDSVDLLLSIMPFEKEWYSRRGISQVEFVGNPVAVRTRPKLERDDFRGRFGIGASESLIALLPGSREKEIARHLQVMLEGSKLLRKRVPTSKFVVAAADERTDALIRAHLDTGTMPDAGVVTGESNELLNAADAAAISSGTATLEAGVLNTPMVVVYKVPTLDYQLFRRLINIRNFALINLVSGKEIVKELIQNEFNAESLANELERLLRTDVNEAMRQELKTATAGLAEGSPSEKAAEAIVQFLRKSSQASS